MFDRLNWRPAARAALALGLVIIASTIANRATAACMDVQLQPVPTASTGAIRFMPAVYRTGDLVSILPASLGATADEHSIVGVWKFKLSGFLKDFGTQAFHAGGTETMFSAGVDPATGDVCQGVWRSLGHSTYSLNHIAMAWTAPGAEYGVLIHIHMLIQLAESGNEFKGSYTVGLFSATPDDPFNESAGPFASGSGHVTASRLQPD